MTAHRLCGLLRTKTAYYRNEQGERIFDPDSTTACYSCLLTQRPYGPDGMPAHPESCGGDRGCYEKEK